MSPSTLAQLATGATLLACVLAVAGVHAYALGRARRAALVDRLAHTGPPPRPGADAASPPWTGGCAAPGSAAGWSGAWRRPG